MKNLFRASLTRRFVIALLIGVTLLWPTFIVVDYLRFLGEQNKDGHNFAASQEGVRIRDFLDTVEDPAQVQAIVAAIDRTDVRARQRHHAPVNAVFQVRDRRDGSLVYLSHAAAGEILHGNPTERLDQVVHGQTYQVLQVDTPRWSVIWARTRIPTPWALKILAGQIIGDILIAIPCLFLPVWIVVSQGLRPLRRFSDQIAVRGPDDMAPLGLIPKQAELQPLALALDDLLAKLRRKMEAEQAFVANAAHELRTPLAVVTAQAHVLSKATSTDERVEAQEHLAAAMSRASHLIHQLLVLARLEMGRPTEHAQVDLAQLVRQQIAHFVPAASRRNTELALEAPDKLVLTLEAESFRTVLQNLVDNAIRYGRDSGKVMVTLLPRADSVVLSVADDGLGIAEEDQTRIFERFYRCDRTADVQGTGLGLAIVKQAVARMRGTLQMGTGLEGRGSCFTLEITSPVGATR